MDVDYYLQAGEFTPTGGVVLAALGESVGLRENTLGSIAKYVENIPFLGSENIGVSRDRSSVEIILYGHKRGCSERALVFCSMARAAGIPTKYVDTLQEEWLSGGSVNTIQGHVFVDVFVDGRWLKYEPIRGFTGEKYLLGRHGCYIDFAEGLDFSNLRRRVDGEVSDEEMNINSTRKIWNIIKELRAS